MVNCTAEAKKNAVAIAKGTTSIESVQHAQKSATASTVGLTIAQTALNAAIGLGIGVVVSLVTKGISKLINAQEDAIDRANEAIAKFEEQRNALSSNQQMISDISSDYVKLAQGVDSLGRNVSLNTEEYARYNEIVNQIADMFPQMVQGYTDEGNAIIANKGNVEALTKAYEDQKKAYQDSLIVQSADPFKGYKSKVDYNANVSWEEAGLFQQKDFANELLKVIDNKDELIKFLDDTNAAVNDFNGVVRDQTLKQAGIKLGIHWDTEGTAEELQRYKDKIMSLINTLSTDINTETAKIKPIMQAYMEQSFKYQGLDTDVQDVVSQIVSQFDSEFYRQFDNETEMANWITENIVSKFEGVDGKKIYDSFSNAFELKTQFQNGDITLEEYLSSVQDFKNLINRFDDNTKKSVELIFSVNSESGLNVDTLINNVKGKLQDKFDDKVGELSLDDLDIVANKLEIDSSVPISWDELIAKIEEYKASLKEGNDPPVSISTTIDQLNTQFKPAFDSLKSAYQEIFTFDDDGKEVFSLSKVDLSSLGSIKSAIDDLNEDGLKIDYSSFENFVRVLTNSSSTAEETQGAFNDFATSILQDTNILNNMNDSTAQLIQSMLESMGVQNAEVIVSQQLAMAHGELAAQKLYLASTGQELESVSIDEQNAFILEKIASGELGKELAVLQLKKMLVNGTLLNESSDINQVLALAQAAGMSVEALTQLKIIKDKFNSAASIGDKNAMDSLSQQASALNAKIKDEVSNFQPAIDFNGNVGKSASKAGKKAADAYKEAFEKELKELQGLRDTGAISEKEYLDRLRELNIRYFKDKEKYLDEYRRYEKEYYDGMIAVYDRVASAATKAIDKQVKSLDKQKNALNDQIDHLEKQKDTVEEYYDAQIQAIEKAKDATEKYYQDQIQTLEDEKDAMEKANEARENALNLQEAQFELERMQNQKTKLVYKDGQLVWQKDTTGIRDKKEEVEKAKYDIAITNINNQVDNLNKSMDEALEKFEEQIKALEDSRDKEIAAIDLQIKGLESQIEVIDKQRDALEEYKELWSEVANDYQEQQDALLAAQVLGADWEAQIMSGRLSVLEDFKNKYAGLYSAMAQIYAESTGGNVTMPSISSEGNSASGSGLNSGNGATGAVTTNGGGAGGNIFTLPGVESEEWGATLDEIIAKLQAFKETFQTEWDEIVDITASSVGVSSGGSDKKPSQDNKKKEAESAAGGIIGILQDGALSMDTVFQEEWLETFRKLIEDDPSLTSYCNNIVEQITSMCDQIIEQLSTATSHINLFMGALQNLGLNGGGKGASASDWLSNLPKRASGLRNAKKPELAVTNEAGPELIYSPSLGGFITPIQPGDSVFKNALTNNLFDWGAISPLQYQDQLMRSINTIPSVEPRTENINVTQNVTFNCPNLTNDSGMQYVMRQFRNLELQAHQRAHMRK